MKKESAKNKTHPKPRSSDSIVLQRELKLLRKAVTLADTAAVLRGLVQEGTPSARGLPPPSQPRSSSAKRPDPDRDPQPSARARALALPGPEPREPRAGDAGWGRVLTALTRRGKATTAPLRLLPGCRQTPAAPGAQGIPPPQRPPRPAAPTTATSGAREEMRLPPRGAPAQPRPRPGPAHSRRRRPRPLSRPRPVSGLGSLEAGERF